jgi:hypothetical protein
LLKIGKNQKSAATNSGQCCGENSRSRIVVEIRSVIYK